LHAATKLPVSNLVCFCSIYYLLPTEDLVTQQAVDILLQVCSQVKPPAAQSRVVDSKLRSEKDYDDERRRHKDEQAKLVALKNQETLERLTNAKKREGEGVGVRKTNFCAYSSPELVPQSRDLQVIVDKKAEVVLLPIYGQLVPFHIQVSSERSQGSLVQEGCILYRLKGFYSSMGEFVVCIRVICI
jgi:nucleosome binding factor SPN SPT16 subunit